MGLDKGLTPHWASCRVCLGCTSDTLLNKKYIVSPLTLYKLEKMNILHSNTFKLGKSDAYLCQDHCHYYLSELMEVETLVVHFAKNPVHHQGPAGVDIMHSYDLNC